MQINMRSQYRNNIKRDKTYVGYITFNKQAKSSFLYPSSMIGCSLTFRYSQKAQTVGGTYLRRLQTIVRIRIWVPRRECPRPGRGGNSIRIRYAEDVLAPKVTTHLEKDVGPIELFRISILVHEFRINKL